MRSLRGKLWNWKNQWNLNSKRENKLMMWLTSLWIAKDQIYLMTISFINQWISLNPKRKIIWLFLINLSRKMKHRAKPKHNLKAKEINKVNLDSLLHTVRSRFLIWTLSMKVKKWSLYLQTEEIWWEIRKIFNSLWETNCQRPK